MTMYQYRITVQSAQGPITEHYDASKWSIICETCEERGLYAKLERRLVVDGEILLMVSDPTGYIRLNSGSVVCPWEILAAADYAGS